VLSGYDDIFGGAGGAVETVKASNGMNSHYDHGDLVAEAAAPGVERLDDSID
jgi:hypothetical protein